MGRKAQGFIPALQRHGLLVAAMAIIIYNMVCCAAGSAPLEVIMQYIENQRNV